LQQQGSAVAFPEFIEGSWPEAVYRVRDRGGVGVLVVPGDALTDGQRRALLRFRFAQYLAAGFLDRDVVFRERLELEPCSPRERSALYGVAFSSRDGQVLALIALSAATEVPGTTLRTRARPLLPLEERFGWGALNRLRLLPDLPLERIREIGSFARNHRLGDRAELGVRGAVEVAVAMARAVTGPLHLHVEAWVGEFEDAVARKTLEFLHMPMVVIRAGVPAVPPNHLHWPGLSGHARYPFAVLVSDMASMTSRLRAIETALAQPGAEGLQALIALKRMRAEPTSSLLPAGGLPSLANTESFQRELSPPARRSARRRGNTLRSFLPLADLSESEATTLGTLLSDVTAESGQCVVRSGEDSDALYFICAGRAEVNGNGTVPAAQLGPGDCFGEIGLLTGSLRTADVTARSRLHLLRLDRRTYLDHLKELDQVERVLARVALGRAVRQLEQDLPRST
jgi:CRP-like cAMP-binding protein